MPAQTAAHERAARAWPARCRCRRHLHRPAAGGSGLRRHAHRQGAVDACGSVGRVHGGPRRTWRRGGWIRDGRPRHHGRHQRCAGAQGGALRAHHHPGLPRYARARPAHTAQPVGHVRQLRAHRAARETLRGNGTNRRLGRGGDGARRGGGEGGGSGGARGWRRSARRPLHPRLSQSRPRAPRRRHRPRSVARSPDHARLRHPARGARVRARQHRRAQRLHSAHHDPLSRPHRGPAQGGRGRVRAAGDAGQWRHDDRRHCGREGGADGHVGAGRRRHRRRAFGRHRRLPQPHQLRHGRHQLRYRHRAGRGGGHDDGEGHRLWHAAPRAHGGHPDHWRRRRQHRAGGRRRHPARRARKRRRGAGSDLLRQGRARAHRNRCQPAAGPH